MQYFTDTDMGLDLGQVNMSVESAFADHGRGLVQMPPKVYITLPGGRFPHHARLSPLPVHRRCKNRECASR